MLKKGAGFAIVLKGRPGRKEQLLLAHATGAPWMHTYSIIKGGNEEGESLITSAIREFKEETGHNLSTDFLNKVKGRAPDFVVQNATKALSGWVVFIDEPEEIGMQLSYTKGKPHIIYPKENLQHEEIDWAGFVEMDEVPQRIAPYQLPILEEIQTIKALDNDNGSPYYHYYSATHSDVSVLGKMKFPAEVKEESDDRPIQDMDLFMQKIRFAGPYSTTYPKEKELSEYILDAIRPRVEKMYATNPKKLVIFNKGEVIELTSEDGLFAGDEYAKVQAAVSKAGQSKINFRKFSGGKDITVKQFTQAIVDYIIERAKQAIPMEEANKPTVLPTPGACKTSTDLTKIVTDSGGTIPYIPIANICDTTMGTVVPKGMYSEMITALKTIEANIQAKYGWDLADYVLNRLQYAPDELGVDVATFKKASPADQRLLMRKGLCGAMSGEQIDAIALAMFNIERSDVGGKGYGMIVGDMTGIGKGRVAAAIIRYCIKYYKKAPVFITEKGYLFSDIYRDIQDIKSDPAVPLQYKTGEVQKKIKMTSAQKIAEIANRIELGDTPDEAKDYVENISDLGYIMVPEYKNNTRYPALADGHTYGRQYLRVKPLIMNARQDETKIKDLDGNILYEPPSAEILSKILASKKVPTEYNLVMLTYSQISAGGETKKKAFIREISEGTIIICDESHNASGESNVGNYIFDILSKASGAVFLSATYSKRPDNMVVYAAKTSIREAELSKEDLVEAVKSGGVPLQEIISSQLVAEGQMVRRERTYAGVNVMWNTLDASMSKIGHPEFDLKDKHSAIANMFTEILRDIIEFQTKHIAPLTKDKSFVKDVLKTSFGERLSIPSNTDITKLLSSSPMFSRVFNVVNQLLFSIKAEAIAERAINYMKEGKKPVIAFANTMGSFLENMTNDEGEPLMSGDVIDTDFKLVLAKLLNTAMSISATDPMDPKIKRKIPITVDMLKGDTRLFYGLIMEKIKTISIGISISPIDVLLYKIKEAGFTVDEVTGRASVVNFTDNTFMKGTYQPRMKMAKSDIFRAFNENRVDCLLINQSGSTGASIQAKENRFVDKVAVRLADGTVISTPYKRGMTEEIVIPNSLEPRDEVKQRVMIMLQAELNINTEVQKMGRIFRSGQLLPPMFEYLGSAIPAEKRLQMIMQKKLHSLFANTSANQRASDELVSVVDFINTYGNKVVCDYLMSNSGLITRLGDPAGMINQKTGAIGMPNPIPLDAAHKTTGRIAILKINEQDNFYTEVSQKYQDYIKFLDEQDEYTGEVKYVDLQATTIDKRIFQVGSNRGTSLFSKNTILETCEVNNLRKPYTSDELNDFLTESLSDYSTHGKNAGYKLQAAVLKEQAQNYKHKLENNSAYYDQLLEAALEKLNKDTSYLNLLQKNPEEAKKRMLADQEAIAANYAQSKTDASEKITRYYNDTKDLLAKLYVGMVTNYVKGDIKVPAVVVKVDIDRTRLNPFTPSNIIVKLAVANGVRSLSVPLSQVEFINAIIAQEERSFTVANRVKENWDEITASATSDRVTRYILTGNILQVMSDSIVVENVGQLIKFTQCRNGKVFIRNGVRLAESFDPRGKSAGGRGGTAIMIPANKCMPVLDQMEYKNGKRASEQIHYDTNNDIQISKINEYDYFIQTDKYNKGFLTDPEVLGFLEEEKGFSSSGFIMIFNPQTLKKEDTAAMGATILGNRMPAFLDFLSERYHSSFRIATGVFDSIKHLLDINTDTDYEDGVGIEESESGLSQAILKTTDPINNEVLDQVQDPVSEHAIDIDAIGQAAVTENPEPTTQIDEALDAQAQILSEKENFAYEKKLFQLFRLLSSGKMEQGGKPSPAKGGHLKASEGQNVIVFDHGVGIHGIVKDVVNSPKDGISYGVLLENNNKVFVKANVIQLASPLSSVAEVIAELGPVGKTKQSVASFIHDNYSRFGGGKVAVLAGANELIADMMGYYNLDWSEDVQPELIYLEPKRKDEGGTVDETAQEEKAYKQEVAKTILQQLGGQRRLILFTGAKDFFIPSGGLPGIEFKFANMGQKVNYVKIVLNGKDYYDVTLGRIWGDEYKVLFEGKDIGDENLASYIVENSGLKLSI